MNEIELLYCDAYKEECENFWNAPTPLQEAICEHNARQVVYEWHATAETYRAMRQAEREELTARIAAIDAEEANFPPLFDSHSAWWISQPPSCATRKENRLFFFRFYQLRLIFAKWLLPL